MSLSSWVTKVMSKANYNELLNKLEAFIKKYYVNQIIKGGLYFTSLVTAVFLAVVLLESIGRFGTQARAVLFFTFLIFLLGILYRFIATPILRLFQLGGNRLTSNQAAKLIGQHFPSVDDKLLNTLELNNEVGTNALQNDLILASIEQRSKELKPVPFSSAIDYKSNRKYLKFALPPMGALLLIFFASPSLITEPTTRIIDFDTHYEIPKPFEFVLINKNLNAVANQDFEVEVKTDGSELPREVYAEVNGLKYLMDVSGSNQFRYVVRNIQSSVEFKFYASGFYSKPYTLNVHAKPLMKNGSVRVTYPKYLNKKEEELGGLSDISIPEGSRLDWNLQLEHCNNIEFSVGDSLLEFKRINQNSFGIEYLAKQSVSVRVIPLNEEVGGVDTFNFNLQVIEDKKPTIQINQQDDSTQQSLLYFKGRAQDDYGFTRLEMRYSLNGAPEKVLPISFNNSVNVAEFYHLFDLKALRLKPEDELVYYFLVADNDGVNGPKVTKSHKLFKKLPSKRQLQDQTKKDNEATKKDLEASIEEAKKLRKDLDDLNKKLLEKRKISWEEKQKLEDIKKRQKQLTQSFEEMKKANKMNNERNNELDPMNEQLLEKQKQLEELMEKVMDEDMKKMLEDLEKMMNEVNKEKLQNQLDKMKLDSKELEKELDRSLEIFKQLEFEKKLDKTIENLSDLKKKERELAKETEEKKSSPEELNKKQEEIQKEFEDIKKDLKDLDKLNEKLEQKNEVPKMEEQKKQADQKMNESKEQNKEGKNKKASQSQKQAADQMEQMEQQLEQAQSKMQEQKQAEDLEALRRLRQNLLELSFEQERLIEEVKITGGTDPKFVALTRQQKRITEDSKMIEDSLFALSKRNVQIQSMVNKEIAEINSNLEKTTRNMANRAIPNALNRQQFVMTSYNNLALMLDESIQQSQKNQSAQKFGKKSCSKPGGGMPSVGDIKKAQQNLSNQLKKLQQQMKQSGGKKQGGKSGGKTGQGGSKGSTGKGGKMSKELAKMAAQQSAIRNELRRMMEQMGDQPGGSKGGNGLKKIEELMDKNEEDLVNKRINQETLKRQEEILSRLLESEKAEREREYDNQREAKEGQDKSMDQQVLEEYKRKKQQQIELLETIPLDLKPFYRNKVNEYYNRF